MWQEIADKTLSSMSGLISTLDQSSHDPDGVGYKHISWSRFIPQQKIMHGGTKNFSVDKYLVFCFSIK